MEFDKFVEGIPGWGNHGIKAMNLFTLGNSLPIGVHIYYFNGNIGREILILFSKSVPVDK